MSVYIRPTWDEYFMEVCRTVAKRATCDRGRSGCVIARDNQILVTGYVGSPTGLPHCDDVGHLLRHVLHDDGSISQHCMRTVHAEQNAMCQAAKRGISIDGATVYCRMTPCRACAMMLFFLAGEAAKNIHNTLICVGLLLYPMLVKDCGIKRIVCEYHYHDEADSIKMLGEAGIEVEHLNKEMQKYKDM